MTFTDHQYHYRLWTWVLGQDDVFHWAERGSYRIVNDTLIVVSVEEIVVCEDDIDYILHFSERQAKWENGPTKRSRIITTAECDSFYTVDYLKQIDYDPWGETYQDATWKITQKGLRLKLRSEHGLEFTKAKSEDVKETFY
ncbi:MAG: hypothetical protein AAFV95_22425 [Bacteroidota bacterium]